MSRHRPRPSLGALEHSVETHVIDDKTLDVLAILLQTKNGAVNTNGSWRLDTPTADDKPESSTTAENTPETAEADYPRGFTLSLLMATLALTLFLVHLDMSIIATAIPPITAEFHSLSEVGWYGSAFFLTLASFQATWGKIYTFFPLKVTFLVAVGIFELGSLLCGVAKSSQMLIIGRAIAGIGGAGISSGAYTISAVIAPPAHRAMFSGIKGAVSGLANAIGPVLGGVLSTRLSWRWCFYLNLPLGGVSAAVLLLFFRPPVPIRSHKTPFVQKVSQMDILGTILILGMSVCYIFALQWAGSARLWDDPVVVTLIVGAGLQFAGFVFLEWHLGDKALLQSRILKNHVISVDCFYTFLSSGSYYVLIYYLPIYFQSIHGATAEQSGFKNIPLVLGVTLVTIASSYLLSKVDWYVSCLIAGSAVMTVGLGLIYTLDPDTALARLIGYQILTGIGRGMAAQVPMIANQASVERPDIAAATAITLFFQTMGGTVFLSTGQCIFINKLLRATPQVASAAILSTGATELRDTFSATELTDVLIGYMAGLNWTIAMAVALSCLTLPIAFSAKWQLLTSKHLTGH